MWFSSPNVRGIGLDLVWDQVPVALFLIGEDRRLEAINRRAATLLGLKAAPEGKALEELFPPAMRGELTEWLIRCSQPGAGAGEIFSPKEFFPEEKRWVMHVSSLPARAQSQLFLVSLNTAESEEPGGLGSREPAEADRVRHRQTEEALRFERRMLHQLMDSVPDKIYFKDLQSRFIRINRAHAKQFGLPHPSQAVGKSDFDFFTEEHAQKAYDEEQALIKTRRPIIDSEQRITLSDGREAWVSTTKLPLYDSHRKVVGTFGISRDITARKQAEEALLNERNRLRTLIDILPSRIFVKDAQGRFVLNNRTHLAALGVESQEETLGKTTRDFYPEQRGDQALKDDREVIESGRPIIDREKSDFGEKGKTRWSITTKVPLRDSHGKIIGLVGMSHDITARKEAEEELRTRNEEMEADLRMAREIQHALLTQSYPLFPHSATPGESLLRFSHRYRPASTLAGDFFDVFAVSENEAGMFICDVMGHGVRAALVTAFLRGLLEELIGLAGDPARFLEEVNRRLMAVLRHGANPMFATVFYCVADISHKQLRFANAGHPAPYMLRRAARRVERIRPPGNDPEPALGLLDDFRYSSATVPFRAGDIALLFTDGIFEVADGEQHEFGEEGLFAAVCDRVGQSADTLLEGVLDDALHFAASDEFSDDVCLLAVEAAGGQPEGRRKGAKDAVLVPAL